MKVYLDNCCFNRPFDEQSSLIIQMETAAKLRVQELIRQGELELIWSFIMDYENGANPFPEKRNRIAIWKRIAVIHYGIHQLSDEFTGMAQSLMAAGLRQMDASHVACAILTGADYFLSTDKKVLNKTIPGIEIINPIDFVRRHANAK